MAVRRTPARRAPRQPPPRFPVAGGVLFAASVLMFAVSWVLFDRGSPGTPLFPDLRADYGFGSAVTVYLPAEAGVTWSAHNVAYRELRGTDPAPTSEQDIGLTFTLDEPPTGPLWVVVELRGGARVDAPGAGEGRKHRTVELGDRQLVLVDIGAERRGVARVTGPMRIPPTSTENSRTAFASPEVGLQKECDGLAALTAGGDLSRLTFARWAAVSSACRETRFVRQTFIRLVTGNAPVRVDYVDVHPMEASNSPVFRWKNESGLAHLRVRSSFVDVDGEAVAERMLFLSGVVVGLAAASGPYAIQSLSAYAVAVGRHRRRRRLRRVSRSG